MKKLIARFKSLPLKTRQLLILGMTLALLVVLPLFVWAILTQRFDLRKRAATGEPTPPPNVYENEFLRIWDSRVFPGIIDLFYKESTDGSWQQYNNIVPIAKVNGTWANAELEKATIETELLSNIGGTKLVKYQFSRLSNGAHFYLTMELAPGQKTVKFSVSQNQDSAPIEAFSLGNYYGYAQLVRYISINNEILDALTYPRPQGGNYELGDFYTLSAPSDNTVKFWGEGGIIQKQLVDAPLSGQDVLMTEVRYIPWLPDQIPPGKNWFETVHITREPFTPNKATWYFGWEEPAISPTPTPTPTSPPTRTPIPTPSPVACSLCQTPYGTINTCQFPDTETGTVSFGRCNSDRRIAQCEGKSYCCQQGYWRNDLSYCGPTPTPRMYYQNLRFRLKFAGVDDDSAGGAKIRIRFLRRASGFDFQTPPVEVTHAGDGVYEATISLVGSSPQIPVNDGYTIFIKGEKHLARKFCFYDQKTRCTGDGFFYIGATNIPSTQTFTFDGLPLEPGDLPPQDGKADSGDFGKITSLFTKLCSSLTEEEKKTVDLDYNGCVNIRDAFLMRKTLEVKFDEY